jgi:hypothetical protein
MKARGALKILEDNQETQDIIHVNPRQMDMKKHTQMSTRVLSSASSGEMHQINNLPAVGNG